MRVLVKAAKSSVFGVVQMMKKYCLVLSCAVLTSACTSESEGSQSSDGGTGSDIDFDIALDTGEELPDSSPDAASDTRELDTSVPADVSLETFSCAGYAVAFCSTLIRCEPYSDDFRNQFSAATGAFSTARECAEAVMVFEGSAPCRQAERGQANGTVAIDAAAADGCIQRIAAVDCVNFEAEWPEVNETCANVPFPTGLVSAGGDCVDNVECAGGLACSAVAPDGNRISERGVCQ